MSYLNLLMYNTAMPEYSAKKKKDEPDWWSDELDANNPNNVKNNGDIYV